MRIAGLDGLRAVAVTGVLLYHGGVDTVPGGFLGVDLFFVISGFLITTLLLEESRTRKDGRFDLVAFWGRRVRRLLPGLALVVLVTVAMFSLTSNGDVPVSRRDAIAALLYVANWHFLVDGHGYFEALAAPSPLLHTWSLAIEEQFYVLWPVLLLLGLRLRVARWARTAMVAAAALGSAVWMSRLDSRGVEVDRLYYGTDTRAQTILVGVLAAFLLDGVLAERPGGRRRRSVARNRAAVNVVGVAALAGVLAAMGLVRADDGALYRGGLLLFAVTSGILVVVVVVAQDSAVTRVLDMTALRMVGVLSYSLYLWHWPVFLFLSAGRTSLDGPVLLSVRLAVTVVLAAAAYHVVEAPVRRSAWRPRRLVAVPVGALAAVAGGALVLASTGPVSAVAGTANASGAGGSRGAPAVRGASVADPEEAVRPPRSARAAQSSPSPIVRGPLRVTILGDSTALTLGEGLRDVPGPHGADFTNAATLGCGVTTASPYRYMGEVDPYERARCATWETRWRRVVSARPADVVAVLVGRWEVADQVLDGEWTHVGTPRFDAYLRHELLRAVDAASSAGARVALLTAPYYSRGEQLDGSTWPEDDPARVDSLNRVLRSVAAARPDVVRVVDLGRRTSAGQRHFVDEIDGVDLRYDGVHFTPAAGRWLEPWLCGQLARSAGAPAGSVVCEP